MGEGVTNNIGYNVHNLGWGRKLITKQKCHNLNFGKSKTKGKGENLS